MAHFNEYKYIKIIDREHFDKVIAYAKSLGYVSYNDESDIYETNKILFVGFDYEDNTYFRGFRDKSKYVQEGKEIFLPTNVDVLNRYIDIKDEDHFNQVIAYLDIIGCAPYSHGTKSYCFYNNDVTTHILVDENGIYYRGGKSDSTTLGTFKLPTVLTPRLWAEERIAYANGHNIEIRVSGDHWEIDEDPRFCEGNEYRIYVAPTPERVFPVTSLTGHHLYEIYRNSRLSHEDSFIVVANEVIKQHILDTEK